MPLNGMIVQDTFFVYVHLPYPLNQIFLTKKLVLKTY